MVATTPNSIAINGRFLVQPITGVQRVAREFVGALDRLLSEGAYPSLRVRLLVPRRGDMIEAPSYQNIEIERTGMTAGHVWEQLELPMLASNDPLICLGNTAPLGRLLVKAGRRTVTVVHDLSYRYFPDAYSAKFRALYSFLIPQVLLKSHRVVTVSDAERQAIQREYPMMADRRDEFIVAQNGASPLGFPMSQDAPPRSARERYALYVGSLTKRKNARGILDTAITLAREDNIRFVFAGSTDASFSKIDMTIPADVADKFTFVGHVNDNVELSNLYRNALVFLFPSHYEASPLPPTEAMASGCPVVCSDIPSLRERCGDAAVYCNPRDTPSIIAAVRALDRDSDLWDRQQRAGLERVQQFSWSGQARKIVDATLFG